MPFGFLAKIKKDFLQKDTFLRLYGTDGYFFILIVLYEMHNY